MKDLKFVNAEDLTNIEEYGAALLTSLISLRTLEAYHIAAFNKGLLDEDEAETGKTICWEIQRLISLYKTQVENVLDRTELKESEILKHLKERMPDVKLPRRKTIKSTGEKKNI